MSSDIDTEEEFVSNRSIRTYRPVTFKTRVPLASTPLAVACSARRKLLGLSLREAAREIGIEHPIYFRAETKASLPDTVAFLKIDKWLGYASIEPLLLLVSR
jgi:hypothetical protein